MADKETCATAAGRERVPREVPAPTYPTEDDVVVTMTGRARDMQAVADLLSTAIDELNSGRIGEPSAELGTMLQIDELGTGGTNEAQWVRLRLRRYGPPVGVARHGE